METYDPQKTKPEVRQADTRKTNSRVLIWSMLGILVLFIILYAVFFMGAPAPEATV
ncbi:hypothetical protein [Devosia sp.]|uniref:hypothetical protein n=1 Tax=Devosia sp. TaxID=1871048 RepID=UPI003A95D2B8